MGRNPNSDGRRRSAARLDRPERNQKSRKRHKNKNTTTTTTTTTIIVIIVMMKRVRGSTSRQPARYSAGEEPPHPQHLHPHRVHQEDV